MYLHAHPFSYKRTKKRTQEASCYGLPKSRTQAIRMDLDGSVRTITHYAESRPYPGRTFAEMVLESFRV